MQAQFSQTYTFYTTSDDGVRLWVNGQPLIDNWTDHAATENSGTIALTAGQRYDVEMEFYENGGVATAKLLMERPVDAETDRSAEPALSRVRQPPSPSRLTSNPRIRRCRPGT